MEINLIFRNTETQAVLLCLVIFFLTLPVDIEYFISKYDIMATGILIISVPGVFGFERLADFVGDSFRIRFWNLNFMQGPLRNPRRPMLFSYCFNFRSKDLNPFENILIP